MRTRMVRLAAAGCLVAGFLATTVATASADPTGSKNSMTVPATCNGRSVEIVVNSANGQGQGAQNQNTAPFAPAHVVGTNEVLHPTVFNLTFSFTDPTGQTFTFLDTNAMKNPKTGVTCVIDHFTQTDPHGGTFGINGTVQGFIS